MPNCLIVYFSQGGTTAKVAECIAAGLKGEGYQTELHNLKDGMPPDLEDKDLLGVGSPVYTFRLPFNVADYLHSLPRLNNFPVFSFNLYGSYRFDAGTRLRKILADKGACDMGYFSCRGEDVVLGYLREGYLFSPDHPTRNELAGAQAFGREVAVRITDKACFPITEESPPTFVFRMERFLCSRWIVEHVMYRYFKVDATRCDNCGICIDLCPRDNIRKDDKGQLRWGNKCLLCFSCEMHCPQDAIRSLADIPGIRPFVLYNIRHTSRDKSLEYVRVKHEKGCTQRL